MAAEPWVPVASKVSIECSFCSHLSADCCFSRICFYLSRVRREKRDQRGSHRRSCSRTGRTALERGSVAFAVWLVERARRMCRRGCARCMQRVVHTSDGVEVG